MGDYDSAGPGRDHIELMDIELGLQRPTVTDRDETERMRLRDRIHTFGDNCDAEPRPPSQRGWDESYRDKMAQIQQEWRRTSDSLDRLAGELRGRGARFVLEPGRDGWVARVNFTLNRRPQVVGRGDTPIEAIQLLLTALR